MIGRNSGDDRETYGLWPWVGGVVFGLVLVWIMFHFAHSI